MASNTSVSAHNDKTIKYVQEPSFNSLLSSLSKVQIHQIFYHPNLYNCFPLNSSDFHHIQLNDSKKDNKKERLNQFDAGKNETSQKIAQIKDSPQETTFIENIESQKGSDNQQCQTSSISYCMSQEEVPRLKETSEYCSYLLPVIQVSPFEIELCQNKQQKGNKRFPNTKNRQSKNNNNDKQVKLKEVEELLQIYNLQKIERNPKQKVNMLNYHTKTVRFLSRICKKSLNRDESTQLAFKYGKQIKTISDFYKTLGVLKQRVASCQTH